MSAPLEFIDMGQEEQDLRGRTEYASDVTLCACK